MYKRAFSLSHCRLLALLFVNVTSVNGANENNDKMSHSNSTMDIKGLRDTAAPYGVHLSGIYKKSFAYVTLKDRLPVILTGVIDTMSRDKEKIIRKFGAESAEELKHVIGDLSRLRSELMTNKPLALLDSSNGEAEGDAAAWNDYLTERREIEGSALTWYNTVWLLSETYMYRRINQALALTQTLRAYDPFENQKRNAFEKSLNSISLLARHVMNLLRKADCVSTAEQRDQFVKLLKLELWGNRCDLSLSAGAESNSVGDPVQLLDSFESDLLVDNTTVVWDLLHGLKGSQRPRIVDIVLDNAGYELFTDLCLASFLIAHDLADKVRFYVKRMPWYVSDVNLHDFEWLVESMVKSEDADLRALGETCARYLKTDKWTIEVESFWTGPYDFGHMKDKAPGLYGKLSESVLVVFKGDLNYRKLLGDVNWQHTTTLDRVLSVSGFRPTNLVTLRTIKADLCIGLTSRKVEELNEKDPSWMITGKYGLIHATGDGKAVCANNTEF